jgi:lantibiotic biosynthesis protein
VTLPAHVEPDFRGRKPHELYAALDWLLVRAPLLPVESYLALAGDTGAAVTDARVLAAIAVGGGDLAGALRRARDGSAADPRAHAKAQRYVIRMSTRPTPYGLFAGVGLAHPGPSTDLALASPEPRTRTRPDMEWLLSFIGELEERPEVRHQLRFRANTAALISAGRVLLAQRAPSLDHEDVGEAVSIRATGPVLRALELAREPCAWARLFEQLLDSAGATEEKVEQLLDDLWRYTLLLSELRPPLTCESPSRYVCDLLREVPAAVDARARLEGLLDEIATWDASSLDEKGARHDALVARARETCPGTDAPPLQVDAALSLAGHQVGARIVQEAVRGAELLVRLSSSGAVAALHDYRQAFVARYGMDREVPLLELLDPDAGLGPPTAYRWSANVDRERSARRDELMWELAVEALRDGRREVVLDDELLEELCVANPPAGALPISLDLAVFVLARDPVAVDAGEFRLLIGPNLGAQAAGRNLGRFVDLLGSDAHRALLEAARAEERHHPQELAVELVYLPGRARSANVAIRPCIRGHEIALGTTPGVPCDRAVPPDELVVGIRDGRFYVRWPRAAADVRVHSGHMLNSMHAPALCRFLEDVARDGAVALSTIDWGAATRLPYLPRLRSDRVILEPARWRIDSTARDRELPCSSLVDFAEALPLWRAAWSVPRRVYLTAGDNRLLIDLDDPLQAEQLRDELHRMPAGGALVLQEPLPDPETTWVPGPGGRYVTELVVPMVRRSVPAQASSIAGVPAPAPVRVASRSARLRPPGSDWLFLKLYCPQTVEEEIIAEPVRAMGEFALAANLADEWFFVRYADPDPHVRLRFRGEPGLLVNRLLPELCRWATELVEEERCLRFAFDTYDREVERYGGLEAASVAEAVFAADSSAVAHVLGGYVGRPDALDRTALAVLTIDTLLAGLGLDERLRLEWYRPDVEAKHESGDEYRARRVELRHLLGEPGWLQASPGGQELVTVLGARDAALAGCARRLDALAASGRLERPKEELCRSYVHLHCNRLLGNGPPFERRILGLLLRTREGLDRAPVAAASGR